VVKKDYEVHYSKKSTDVRIVDMEMKTGNGKRGRTKLSYKWFVGIGRCFLRTALKDKVTKLIGN
jgi:hypothetical protein